MSLGGLCQELGTQGENHAGGRALVCAQWEENVQAEPAAFCSVTPHGSGGLISSRRACVLPKCPITVRCLCLSAGPAGFPHMLQERQGPEFT